MARVLKMFCVVLFVLLGSANAGVITFQFTGSVTQVPLDEVFGDINFGDAIQGSFSFDTAGVDLIPADPNTGSYNFDSPLGMNVSIGGHDFSTSGTLNIGILNGFVDQFTVLATSSTGNITLELLLQDNTGSVFANDHLPLSAPSLASFAQRDFHLDAVLGGGEIQADGRLNVLAVQGTPEPASLGVVVAGLCLLGLAGRRRR